MENSIYKVFDAGMIIISFALSVLLNIFLNNQYFKRTWGNALEIEQLYTNILHFLYL